MIALQSFHVRSTFHSKKLKGTGNESLFLLFCQKSHLLAVFTLRVLDTSVALLYNNY